METDGEMDRPTDRYSWLLSCLHATKKSSRRFYSHYSYWSPYFLSFKGLLFQLELSRYHKTEKASEGTPRESWIRARRERKRLMHNWVKEEANFIRKLKVVANLCLDAFTELKKMFSRKFVKHRLSIRYFKRKSRRSS